MRIVDDRFTRRDYDLLPEGFPAQLIEGQLVREAAPTYGHQRIALALVSAWVRCVGWERVGIAPQDVGIDDFNVFQPDVLLFREPPPDDVRDIGIPLVAAEVLTPSTARRDRVVKRRRLLGAGCAEVWILDPEARTVEVFDLSGSRVARGNERIESRAVPGLGVVPDALFTRPDAPQGT